MFAVEPCLKTLRSPHVHDEFVLKKIFVKGLLQSIRHSRRSLWSSHQTALLQHLLYKATVLTNLKHQHVKRSSPKCIQRVSISPTIVHPIADEGWFRTLDRRVTRLHNDSIMEAEWNLLRCPTQLQQCQTIAPQSQSTRSRWTVATVHHSVWLTYCSHMRVKVSTHPLLFWAKSVKNRNEHLNTLQWHKPLHHKHK